MTQTKRIRNVPQVTYTESDILPATIPYNWDCLIMNRTFKRKVIKFLMSRIPELINLQKGQTLIMDHEGHPLRYTGYQSSPSADTDMPPMGEADVKCTRYTKYGNLLIDATDGDYVPIALLHVSNLINERWDELCDETRKALAVQQISVLRIECKGKRQATPVDTSNRKRCYEYVHINSLYMFLQGHFRCIVPTIYPSSFWDGFEMHVLGLLIAITGCDFTRGLAQMTANKMWLNLGIICKMLARAIDPVTREVDVPSYVECIGTVYTRIYQRHIGSYGRTCEDIMHTLKHSAGLSESIRKSLPTHEQIECSVRNANWVLIYWNTDKSGVYPTPIDDKYGYTLTAKGRPCWSDSIET